VAPATGEDFSDPAENETEISSAPAVKPELPAAENAVAEPPAETADAPVAEPKSLPPLRPERPQRPERPERFERRNEPRPAKPVYVKPADFRPAETSAIHEAVAHATEIAMSLKQMIDQFDEILELVEVAERQKLADEREIDELRRALRRIQPPRQQPPPPRDHRPDRPSRGQPEPGHQPEAPAGQHTQSESPPDEE